MVEEESTIDTKQRGGRGIPGRIAICIFRSDALEHTLV